MAAVDGNFYRVLSRVFADNYDVSNSKAFDYFSELALMMMPENEAGTFNESMMDLGSEICKPRNPLCDSCPLNKDCLAFNLDVIPNYPVKTKKVKATDLELEYSFVEFNGQFLIRQRKDDFIWKKLYEFPIEIPAEWEEFMIKQKIVTHKLTHKNLKIQMSHIRLRTEDIFTEFAHQNGFSIITFEESHQKSFPKPLENYLVDYYKNGGVF